jgi:hypothetical protein
LTFAKVLTENIIPKPLMERRDGKCEQSVGRDSEMERNIEQ